MAEESKRHPWVESMINSGKIMRGFYEGMKNPVNPNAKSVDDYRRAEEKGITDYLVKGAEKAGRGVGKAVDFSSAQIKGAVDYAKEAGINAIVNRHPGLMDIQDELVRNLRNRDLNDATRRISRGLERYNLTPEQRERYAGRILSDYVASGRALREEGKEQILRGTLEEKAQGGSPLNPIDIIGRFLARRALKGEEYLDRGIEAFKELYHMMRTGDYRTMMPELSEKATEVYKLGLLNPVINTLGYFKLMSSGKYLMLKNSIKKGIEKGTENFVEKAQNYITTPSPATATVFGILGLGMLTVFGTKITGGAIGASESNIAGAIAGLALLFTSLTMLARSFKK